MSTFTGRPTTDAARPRVDATNWRDWRACAGEDPDLFADDDRRTAAKAVCVRCPVRSFCLQLALDTNTREGVYGGLDEDERRPLLRPQSDMRVEDFIEAITTYRRKGWSWERIGSELGFPRGSIRNRVAQWTRREQRAGRSVPAEFVEGRAGLSEAQVLEIRRRAQQGESDTTQALRTGLSKSSVGKVATGARYPEFGGPLRKKRQGFASRPSLASCTQFNNKSGASHYRQVKGMAS